MDNKQMKDLTIRSILNESWGGRTVRELNGMFSQSKIKFVVV